jgi:hypothetical protein
VPRAQATDRCGAFKEERKRAAGLSCRGVESLAEVGDEREQLPAGHQLAAVPLERLDEPAHVRSTQLGFERDSQFPLPNRRLRARGPVDQDRVADAADTHPVDPHTPKVGLGLNVGNGLGRRGERQSVHESGSAVTGPV